jgi:thiol-disulfide isomerase/thioredoxin
MVAKRILRLFFFIIPVLINAQDSFIIHGKIERLTKSDSIILGSSWGTFKSKIKNDGSFLIYGEGVKTPGDALIYTDSSSANAIWLEPGEYNIECKEIKISFSPRPIFRIPKLIGPKDAELSHGYSEQLMEFNLLIPRERRLEITHSFIIRYIDSVFKYYPSSKALPKLLTSALPTIGDDAVENYYSLLLYEQVAQPGGGEGLANYFKRKDKIEKEKYFQDFEMKDQNGKIFKLSSLNKKLILLDFWASWCAPCRHNHPKLVDLYNKYSDKGLEIISISLDSEKKDWLDAIAKDNMTWINVSEVNGWETKIAKDYFVSGIPFSFLLDKDRKIIAAKREFTSEEIEKYLK